MLKNGINGLHIACGLGNLDVIRILIKNNANINALSEVWRIMIYFFIATLIILFYLCIFIIS